MQSGKDIMYPNQEVIKPHLRLATEQDCLYLAENLREEDYREIQAALAYLHYYL